MIVEETPAIRYDHQSVEKRWKTAWNIRKLDSIDLVKSSKPYYNLMMFPYPSAEGLHVGNMYAFTGSDIHGRFMRMNGYDVFEPIGLDGFGIHSENYALKVGRNPHEHAKMTETHFYDQLKAIGAMFSWEQTLETYDPEYYAWTQWLFTEMFKHGLAYRKKASVNYCPSCKTVLADEQVINGVCERCGNTVEKRALEQWFFRITAYAEKLLKNTAEIKWSEKVKTAQVKWIGKKEGINISYPVFAQTKIGEVSCFTTRPDTNFGATFIVIAPEHEMVATLEKYVNPEVWKEITVYVRKATQKTEMERIAEGHSKSGIDTGLYCLNQLNNIKMPLYISDFVLKNFGTGAVVGVPGHDVRDFEFAQSFGIPVIRVVTGVDNDQSDIKHIEQVQEDAGKMMNSEFLDGMDIHEATEKMMEHLEEKGWGKRMSSYHIRDWLISRQRYWGPPIPMIYCEHCASEGKSWFTTEEGKSLKRNNDGKENGNGDADPARIASQSENGWPASNASRSDAGWYPVPESDLPVLLPEIDDYTPGADGVAPLARHKEFYEVACPGCGKQARRETDVSDTFLDSSWYFLRYPSIGSETQDTKPFDPERTKTWLPVSMYTGGAEHSVLHLLYSRFVTMALHDWGYVPFEEPFPNFFAHGLVIKDGAKMSKSKGNVVNPDEYIAKYGADALRLYLMFMGPFSDGGDFRDTGMEGMVRWLGKIWRLIMKSANRKDSAYSDGQKQHIYKELQKIVAKVSDDMPKRRYNTAIAGLMEFTNAVSEDGGEISKNDAKIFLQLLAPFAPYISEELWQILHDRKTIHDKKDSIHFSTWPVSDPDALIDEMISFVIQVNGKVREILTVNPQDAKTESKMIELAQNNTKITAHIENHTIRKTIFVPGKLINFVI